MAVLALLPLGYVVGFTATTPLADLQRLLLRARTAELLVNTTQLTVVGVVLCAVLGVGAAWVVERRTVVGRRVWHVLLVAPLAVPAFVSSYAWISVAPTLNGLDGALLVVVSSYFPLVYLPVVAMMRRLDPALEDTARALGLSEWAVFRRVVLPQVRPAVLGGSLLVALHMLSEFGALQLLQFPTFTTAIYDQYRSSFAGPAATALASVLVLACLLLLVAEQGARGSARYARVGQGTARAATPVRTRARLPLTAVLAVVVGITLVVPLGILVRWLALDASTGADLGRLGPAVVATLGLGLAAAVLTLVLALPVGWLAVRHRGAVATVVERSTWFASALPGIVVALALITLTIRHARPLYQTVWMLLAAYAILFLPRAVTTVRAALAQAPPGLGEAARGLGAGTVGTFLRVEVPLMAPGLGAGAALVFIAASTELTSTLLLAPTGTRTLATQFWSHSTSLEYSAAAPYAALLVAVSAPATWLLTRASTRRPRRGSGLAPAVVDDGAPSATLVG
ncbi:iron ABC transporter permease [Rhodococcus antarcticus]|uniref:Iron ABC transporter permease n=1 Tax=Rhodococcus antarcticus TaxID=2987751 RepID=A0ABY6P0H8_9NOCA|nr:iron ABC transporter permease [Rhodococcus antarcticus]UZJ25140.1 iron ABC transporter permease [Rhodococcus antarcticus]